MADIGSFSGSVLRVFEARAKAGQADTLRQRFATTSVDVVLNQPGNQGYFLGKQLSDGDDTLVFVSVWKNLDAIKSRFGDDWESSYLPPGYVDIIESCSLKHIALQRDWETGS